MVLDFCRGNSDFYRSVSIVWRQEAYYIARFFAKNEEKMDTCKKNEYTNFADLCRDDVESGFLGISNHIII